LFVLMKILYAIVCILLLVDIEDLLVCGSCRRDFPLCNIVNFVDHKKFDCADQEFAKGRLVIMRIAGEFVQHLVKEG